MYGWTPQPLAPPITANKAGYRRRPPGRVERANGTYRMLQTICWFTVCPTDTLKATGAEQGEAPP